MQSLKATQAHEINKEDITEANTGRDNQTRSADRLSESKTPAETQVDE